MITTKAFLPALWILGTFLLATIDLAVGQIAPKCNGIAWDWSYNSRGQSPCLVAAYLLAPCRGGQYSLPALEPHMHYTPPNDTSADNCFCSSVVYSLISTCVACQLEKSPAESDPPVTWSKWQAGCSNSMISLSKYPNVINPVTAVPGWAYFDVVTADTFNIVNASLSLNLPESTVGNRPTSTTSTSPTSSNRRPDTSLIIGVAMRGVTGLILIVAFVIIHMKKQPSIEHVIDSKYDHTLSEGQLLYHVKRTGPRNTNWILASTLDNERESHLTGAFHSQYPDKPGPEHLAEDWKKRRL